MQRRLVLGALFLLTVPVVAGCISITPAVPDLQEVNGALRANLPAPALVCFEKMCNLLATVQNEQANELSIAVNPTNPLNIIASGKDYTKAKAGDCVWDGYYTTTDGGKTWVNGHPVGSPWARLNDPSEPVTPISNYWCVTDPVMRFGADGTAYWTIMPYQCDAASGSKLGDGVHPNGGMNDFFWTCSAMYVLTSQDGGVTWPVERYREVAVGPRLAHDKQWIAVAPDAKTVLLCWTRYDDKGEPTRLAPVDPADMFSDWYMVCSVSKDKGDTWSDYRRVNDGWYGSFPLMEHAPDGTAHMVFVGYDDDGQYLGFTSSKDGLSWDAPTQVSRVTMPPRGAHNRPTLAGSEFRVNAAPGIAIDKSGGPNAGSIYVTWMNHANNESDVYFARSRDGGATWSAPLRVNDDPVGNLKDQFMPAISVGPDGIVDLSWLDRRDDPDNYLWTPYYAYSVDGEHFSRNYRVGEHLSDEVYSRHQNGMVFLGDYRDSASSDGAAHILWTDTRNEKADVYVATILRGPSAAKALPPGAAASLPTFG